MPLLALAVPRREPQLVEALFFHALHRSLKVLVELKYLVLVVAVGIDGLQVLGEQLVHLLKSWDRLKMKLM